MSFSQTACRFGRSAFWFCAALSAALVHTQTSPEAAGQSPLVKLPVAFPQIAETTPVVFDGRPLLVLNHHEDLIEDVQQRRATMRLCVWDLRTGKEITTFGPGHTFVSAVVAGDSLHAFARHDQTAEIYHFQSTDLKTWSRQLAIAAEGGEQLCNSSVCRDDQGWLMAYESSMPVQYCFKFARSTDLETWNKIEGLVYAGEDGRHYSACPVIRYLKPYYYVIYLREASDGRRAWMSTLARSTDLATWQPSPINPILEAAPGEGCNNSDVDLFEWGGNTYFYYATGNQQTWYSLRVAMYPGAMKEFFEGRFSQSVPLETISARNTGGAP